MKTTLWFYAFSLTWSLMHLCIVPPYAAAEHAPNAAVYTIKGERHILYGLLDGLPAGGVAILNFTSVYCLPCKKEIPELRDIAGRANKVKLFFIYAEEAAIAGPHAKKMGICDCSYVDALRAVQAKFGVKKYPVTILINKKREIVGRFEGYTVENIEEIKRIVTLR